MTIDRGTLRELLSDAFQVSGMGALDSRLFAKDAVATIEPILAAAEGMREALVHYQRMEDRRGGVPPVTEIDRKKCLVLANDAVRAFDAATGKEAPCA
jgi:hypothetical protein